MRVIFFGTSEFAVPALNKLAENGYDISAVFTSQGPILRLAKPKYRILQPKSLKDDKVFDEFKGLSPDICIIAAYGKIIPERYLQVPKYGFLNIHPSLLPKYRGPSPIQTAILESDPAPSLSADPTLNHKCGADRHSEKGRAWGGAGTETGVTIMQVDKEMDH